jgi:hypothetical protein
MVYQCAEPDPPAPPPPPSNAAGWVFGAVLLVVLVFELWADHTHHLTISQWMRRLFGRHRWWRPVALSVLAGLLWHLFFGGPL